MEHLYTEAVAQRCSVKKVFLKNFQNSQENICARVSFLLKLKAEAFKFIKKETLAQVFSCKFCEIFNNRFFYRTPRVAALYTSFSPILSSPVCSQFLLHNKYTSVNI